MPEPSPYIPGQTPFPGIPDFIRDLDFSNIDFSNIPGLSNFDYDDIMRQYNDRMEMGEPEPVESFLPDPRDLPPVAPTPAPISVETIAEAIERKGPPTGSGFIPEAVRDIIERREEPSDISPPTLMSIPPLPQFGPFGPGMSIEDILKNRETTMPMPMPVGQADTNTVAPGFMPVAPAIENTPPSPTSLANSSIGGLGMPSRPSQESIREEMKNRVIDDRSFLERISSPTLMPDGPVLDRRPSPPRMPAPPAVAPINIPKITKIPKIDFSNLRKFDLPTTGGRPMIPDFGNFDLR
jgi:hypothetical protein